MLPSPCFPLRLNFTVVQAIRFQLASRILNLNAGYKKNRING